MLGRMNEYTTGMVLYRIFFCFQPKTAYELRISDWSSDVCSSDLTQWRAFLDPDGVRPSEERAMAERSFSRGVSRGGLVCGTYALLPEVAGKIGRASCRERVCQYV